MKQHKALAMKAKIPGTVIAALALICIAAAPCLKNLSTERGRPSNH
jgi:hypothetical protein